MFLRDVIKCIHPMYALFLIVGISTTACVPAAAKLENRNQDDITDIRTLQAEQSATIRRLESEIRELNGVIQELEYLVQNKIDTLDEQVNSFSERMPPPEGVSPALLSKDSESIGAMQADEAELFSHGLSLLRKGAFARSREKFQEFLVKSPDSNFSDNSLYWVGVSYEKQGQYDRAIVAYSDVYQLYPKSDRVPDALFRLAVTFTKTKSIEEAVLTLEKLIEEHPASTYTSRAKDRLKSLSKKKG